MRVGRLERNAVAGDSVAGFAMVIASAAGFAAMPVFVKLAYRSGSSLWNILASRFVLAALILYALEQLRRRRESSATSASIRKAGVILGSIFVLTSLSMFVALQYVPAGMASFLFYTYPALVTALSRERLTRARIGIISLAGIGCALMFGVTYEDFAMGGLFALLSAASYTAYILLGDHVARTAPPLAIATNVVLVAAVWFVFTAIVAGDVALPGSATAIISIVGIGLLSTSVALYAFLEGVKRIGPSAAALVSTIEPVVTIFLAWLLLGETLVPTQYAGAALILVSIAALRGESAGDAGAT